MSKRDISTVSFASKRAQIIKKAKSDDKGKYVGTKLDTTEKEPVKDEVEFPKVVKRSHELDDQLEVGIYSRKRKGVSFSDPKIILKGDGKKRNVTVWLPPMKVKYASLGENGNLGRFTDDVNRARFTVQLESDVPEEMGEVRKSMEKAGDDAIDFIKKWSNQAMEIAFHDESTWTDKCKRYDDDQAFVKMQNIPSLKRIMKILRIYLLPDVWKGGRVNQTVHTSGSCQKITPMKGLNLNTLHQEVYCPSK